MGTPGNNKHSLLSHSGGDVDVQMLMTMWTAETMLTEIQTE